MSMGMEMAAEEIREMPRISVVDLLFGEESVG